MAKIKFGMFMTDARGKVGGQVFSKNRSGAYVRTKVTPVNPRSTFQQANRAVLGALSSSWSGLTEEQRKLWNSVVEDWQKTNVFGDLVKPTGKNLFTGLNSVRLSMFPQLQVLETPPNKGKVPVVRAVEGVLDIAGAKFEIEVNGSFLPGTKFQVRATAPVSLGTSYVKNRLRVLGVPFDLQAGSLLDVFNEYVLRFGAPAVGAKIFFEVSAVLPTGQLGVASSSYVIAE